MIVSLDEDTFDEYAVKNYRNPNCVSVLEFLDDLKTIKYIKRLFNKYYERDDLRERLILNHIISLSNVFGVEATVNMLYYKIHKSQHDLLNAFFVFLKYVDPKDIETLDLSLYNKLNKVI